MYAVTTSIDSHSLWQVCSLITHPGDGKSFDYENYWDTATGDLIYTGRGNRGDRTLTGPNGDVVENRRHLLVFETEGQRRLRFLTATAAVVPLAAV